MKMSCYKCGLPFCDSRRQGPKNDYGYLCWYCVVPYLMKNMTSTFCNNGLCGPDHTIGKYAVIRTDLPKEHVRL